MIDLATSGTTGRPARIDVGIAEPRARTQPAWSSAGRPAARRASGRRGRAGMKRLLPVVAMVVVCGCGRLSDSPVPVATPSVTASPVAPSLAPSPSSSPSQQDERVTCTPGPPAQAGDGDPCPDAVAAVRAAVASVGGTIARIVIAPHRFNCGDLWPGVASAQLCFGPIEIAGTTMHGWVGFLETRKVAAVSLWRGPPSGVGTPSASGAAASPLPGWQASVDAFAVPPAGWVMP